MPGRFLPLVTNYYYHVYNRGSNGQPIFLSKRDYQRFKDLLSYYQHSDHPGSYSKFLILKSEERQKILRNLSKEDIKYADIICYCLMPNHFHVLLKQNRNDGISKLMATVQNGYARYFNKKQDKFGPLFQGRFKAVLVNNEEQLLHLTRYIHLNPYSSAIVNTSKQLKNYPWSSLQEYLSNNQEICKKEIIISHNKSKNYKDFVFNRKDYQKELKKIEFLTNE
ncbi:MAG: transposase [Candidatus Shapirobacteria bacterium]